MPGGERGPVFLHSGVFNLIKPPGPSSQDLVTDVKRMLNAVKVGHTGTLDPGAAGVLPVCVGKATRLFDYLVDKKKHYRCEILFGVSTDTLDSYGRVTARDEAAAVTEADLRAILSGFLGESIQQPPMYSALKIDGQKMYQRARKGGAEDENEELRRKKARTIVVDRLDLVAQTGPNRFLLDMECSKGTYVRVLCEDIGKRLGTVAVTSFLLRTASGPFRIADAITLDELRELSAKGGAEKGLIPMDKAVGQLPKVILDEKHYRALSNGNEVPSPPGASLGEFFRVYCAEMFFGIGECVGNRIKMRTMLKETDR